MAGFEMTLGPPPVAGMAKGPIADRRRVIASDPVDRWRDCRGWSQRNLGRSTVPEIPAALRSTPFRNDALRRLRNLDRPDTQQLSREPVQCSNLLAGQAALDLDLFHDVADLLETPVSRRQAFRRQPYQFRASVVIRRDPQDEPTVLKSSDTLRNGA